MELTHIGAKCASIRPAMLVFALKKLRNRADAEDATGDTIAIAIENAAQFDDTRGEGALTRWIFGILDKVIKDIRRERARRGEVSLEMSESDEWIAVALVEAQDRDYLRSIELRMTVRERLKNANLTARQREALNMRLEAKSLEEIASLMKITVPTVKRHLADANIRLKRAEAVFSTPDVNDWFFKFCKEVTVYRDPPKIGNSVWREKYRKMR